jgi:hypothetical protein
MAFRVARFLAKRRGKDKMNLTIIVAQSLRRLRDGSVRLQKLDMKRVAFFVTLAASGSLSLLFFQNFTGTPPSQPQPPATYTMKPNFRFITYENYLIPVIRRGNPRPISPQVAAQGYLLRKAANIASTQRVTGDQSCKTVNVSYKDKDPVTNLAVRTFTFVCGGNQVVTLNEVLNRGPNGSPNPVAQLLIKSPLKINNAQAAIRN